MKKVISIIIFVLVLVLIPYTTIKYKTIYTQTEKQYLSDGYHVVDIAIDGFFSKTYAIDAEQLDAYILGKETISVKNIPSGTTEIIKTSKITRFTVTDENE